MSQEQQLNCSSCSRLRARLVASQPTRLPLLALRAELANITKGPKFMAVSVTKRLIIFLNVRAMTDFCILLRDFEQCAHRRRLVARLQAISVFHRASLVQRDCWARENAHNLLRAPVTAFSDGSASDAVLSTSSVKRGSCRRRRNKEEFRFRS